MRLFIFSNRDLASNYHLNLLLPQVSQWVRGVFLSDAVGRADQPPPPYPLRELKFFEQHLPNELLFPALEAGNGTPQGKLLTFNQLAQRYGIPFLPCNSVRSAAFRHDFAALQPDVVLSVRFGKIFDDAFLRIPSQVVLNLHSGLLPNYRGVLASFRALLHGDDTLFSTLHTIDDASIDTGRIIGCSPLPVQPGRSLLWHVLQLYPESIALSVETLRQLALGGPGSLQTRPNTGGQYFTFPSEQEWAEFLAQGHRVCDVAEMRAFYAKFF
jgi:methionyl-tRNA formyltransferase